MHHLHRKKLFSLFDEETAIVYVKGAELMYRYDTDYEFAFRQESNFWYLTGVDEADFHLILDLNTQEYHLFVPNRDAQYAVWHGIVKSKEQYQSEYDPDHLHYDSKLPQVLKELDAEKIYCLDEEQAEFIEEFDREVSIDLEALPDALTHCRVFKTDWELDQLREAARVNNIAHRGVLEALEPGKYEYEMKAVFDYHQIGNGLMQDAYNGIFAAGKNSAILHYVENSRKIKDGDLFLIDAGYECNGYASDFTRTYPASGKFSAEQAEIYEAVLEAQKQVIEAAEPDVKMEDLHVLSARVMMQGLKDANIVTGSIDDLMENDVFALFFPHGLGHFLGLDTHDVGGYPKGVERIERPGIKYLRMRRTLQSSMVLTIEPGLYFVPALLKPALEDEEMSKFLNASKLKNMMEFGGVRIEDNLIITDDGFENMTDVPKERSEIEKEMA
ncbi:aminopeptidase P family protein [Aliifodinibius salicampi]|uniref:Aminopeptidase P family protein n=1 Tax=Fodinibius salicampi TaxID=1920655 RepID=A0ABT3Q0R3_9BACT|nr:aminopeptidase P family protein [Fodinibius salicampi]MCW9713695.1 aminopeptidase P family protein [Fodinibius salicampi]